MADRCDVPGCEQDARLFAPTRRRCLAHADGQAPSLRSDVPAPVSRDPVRPCADCGTLGQWGQFTCCDPCWDKAHPKAPDTDVRPPPLPIGEPERRLWRQRVAVALILQVEAERQARAAEEWARGYEKRRDEQHRLAAEAIGCDDCAWLRHQVDRLQRERDGFEASWRDARAWAERERAAADAAHAALDATTGRLVAAADILRRYGDIGAQAALRALEGETT